MMYAAKCNDVVRLTGSVLLCFGVNFAFADETEIQTNIDCSIYRRSETATLPIGVFRTPEIYGGTMEMHELIASPEYLAQPWSNLSATDEIDHTALFEVDIYSGLPPTELERSEPFERTYLVLLLHGRAYSRPGFFLGAFAGAPVSEPLTIASFDTIGDGPSGFVEIRVEGQADHVTRETQIFAEIGSEGELTALLKCSRPRAVPNPICQISEQVGIFGTDATFRRSELDSLDLVRERVASFTLCLSEER